MFVLTGEVSKRDIFYYSSNIMVRTQTLFTNFSVTWLNLPPSPNTIRVTAPLRVQNVPSHAVPSRGVELIPHSSCCSLFSLHTTQPVSHIFHSIHFCFVKINSFIKLLNYLYPARHHINEMLFLFEIFEPQIERKKSCLCLCLW